MPSVPGYCAQCDLVFDGTGGIYIENSRNITLRDNKMSCPQCGRPAKLAEGTFNVSGDQFELISGPPLTLEILARLRDIAERARSREITPAAAIQEANEIDPVLGRLFEKFLSTGFAALAAFIGLIGIYMQHHSIELQKESLALQERDSKSSGDFYKDAIELLREQTEILRKHSSNPGVENKRKEKSSQKAHKTPPAIKKPSKRRAEVNSQRREELRSRRMMLNPRKQKPDS